MISQFKINNFRLFENIEINHLSHVNLIVGKNSAGKSALLEAFVLFFSKMSAEVLIDILYTRQESWDPRQNYHPHQLSAHLIRHLFKGHKMPGLHEEGFKLSSGADSFHIRTGAYIYDENKHGGKTQRIPNPDELEQLNSQFIDRYLVLEEGSSLKMLYSLESDLIELSKKVNHNSNIETPYQSIPTCGISDVEASLLWDSISLTELEKEVIEGLKLIEPMIIGLTFVQNSDIDNTQGRIPIIRIANVDETLPLRSLGDGMNRVFQIILCLVCAKDGVLMIDEFENGLHWSIQNDVWNIVFTLAKRLNVQVFCSTHSRDCINSFEKVWGDHKTSGHFMRVTKEDGHAQIREYDFELLSDSIETDVEVR
ncbi:MAG: AAA15 family ATPase/GTPase [Phenylobacterium sp.]|jgi:AAA15 family ATPase/GTPase